MSSQPIKRVPDHVEDITPEWFTEILRKPVRSSSFKLTPNAHAGTGFMSTLVRAEFETDEDVPEVYHVVVKLLPEESNKIIGEIRDLVLRDTYDQTEILTYTILIPDLVREIPEIKKYFCDMVFGDIRQEDKAARITYSSVLVLRDLKFDGYFMVNFGQDFKPAHFSQGLDFLTKLHAASLSFEKRVGQSLILANPWFPKWYTPIQPGENRSDPTLFSFFPQGFPTLYELLSKTPGVTDETYKALKVIELNTDDIFRAMIRAGQAYPCLIHADMWPHNFMVQENTEIPIKAIDWQMIGYSDPTFDLAIYTILCLPFESITVERVNQAALEYYEKKSVLLEHLGLKIRRNWEEFERFFQTYGLAYGFIWLVMACQTLIRNPEYEPKFRRIFDVLVDMKIVDFVASLV